MAFGKTSKNGGDLSNTTGIYNINFLDSADGERNAPSYASALVTNSALTDTSQNLPLPATATSSSKNATEKIHHIIDTPTKDDKFNRISLARVISSISVEPTILLYTFSYMIYQPVFNYMMMNKLCLQTCGYSSEQCREFGKAKNRTVDVDVQKAWAVFDNYSTILNTAPGIIFALFMGPWSDVFGRKTLLAIPFIGTVAGNVFTLLLYFLPSLPVWTLFLPNFVHNLTGGMTALVTGAFAYSVDISTEGSSRTIRIVLVNIFITIGFSSAGLVSALLVGEGVPHYVCYILAFCLAAAGFVYTVWCLRETRRPDRPYTKLEATVALFKIHHLVDSGRCVAKKRRGWGRFCLWLLFIAFLIDSVIFFGEKTINQKFFTAAPLSWSLSYYMLFDGVWGFIGMFFMGVFVVVAKRRLKWSDITLSVLGNISHGAMVIIISVAHTTWMIYLAYSAGVLKSMVSSATRAMMSKLVQPDEQGKLFSLVTAFEGVMPLLGSVVATAIFTATVDFWPGCYNLVAACAAIVPLIMLLVAGFFVRRDARQKPVTASGSVDIYAAEQNVVE